MSFVSSFFSGLSCLCGFFLLSLFIVVGIKWLSFFIKEHFYQKPVEVLEPPPIKRKRKRKTPTPVRSIEIDPQEVDRIYVKKAN